MNAIAPTLDYGSVCSGIEAATVAWKPLGLQAAWYSEIAPFPSAVLAHHYPQTPNLGDMTLIADRVLCGSVRAPDVLVGGTPCQSFSIAGMRQGLADARGALTLKYVELANAIDKVRTTQNKAPSIVVWENVPGVLNDKANAFGCFLGALSGERCELQPAGPRWTDAGCVYGYQRAVAWRILDAQHIGVAQRRKRVFLVSSARKDFDPAAVLFECESVRRDSPPSRETLEGVASTSAPCAHYPGRPSNTQLHAQNCKGCVLCFGGGNTRGPIDPAACLTARGHKDDFEVETFALQGFCGPICHPLTRAHGVTEDGNGRGTPVVAITYRCDNGEFAAQSIAGNISHTLNTANSGKGCSEDGTGRGTPIVAVTDRLDGVDRQELSAGFTTAIAFAENSRGEVRLEGGHGQFVGALSTGGGKPGQGRPVIASVSLRGRRHGISAELGENICPALRASSGGADKAHVLFPSTEAHFQLTPAAAANGFISDRLLWRVRRLMPVECERLQGLPDNYTLIPYRGAPAADGPRYAAIGNSMAVPCMTWIGRRLLRVLARIQTS